MMLWILRGLVMVGACIEVDCVGFRVLRGEKEPGEDAAQGKRGWRQGGVEERRVEQRVMVVDKYWCCGGQLANPSKKEKKHKKGVHRDVCECVEAQEFGKFKHG
jgi:hypothetical protein